MKVLEQTEATAPLAEYTAGIDQEPVIITSNGKPIAALLPIENADLETVSLSTNPKFLELIERSRVRHRTEEAFLTRRCGIGWVKRIVTGPVSAAPDRFGSV